MKEKLRFLGLDVHAETIAVAIAEADGEVRSLGTIPTNSLIPTTGRSLDHFQNRVYQDQSAFTIVNE
jgi:hypothetical protein